MQSQKQQNDLSSFPRQTIQYHIIQVYAPTANAKEAELLSPHATLLKLMCLKPVLLNLEVQ